MRTIIHSTEAATASSAECSSPTCFVARGAARPAHNVSFKLLKFTQQLFRQLLYAHYGCFALACLVSVQGAAQSSDFIVLIILFSLISSSTF